MLTTEQIQKYEEDGYVVLRDFIEPSGCDRLRQRAEDLVREFDPAGVVSIFSTREQARTSDDYFLESGDKIRFFFEENAFNADGTLRQSKERSINKIGHALHDLDPVFDEFSRRTGIKELVNDLGFSDPLLLQSMYIFKQPNIGGEVTCHQDGTFLFTEPLRVIGLWFALEDATVENGCLWTIPGGHKAGLKSRFVRVDQRDVLPHDRAIAPLSDRLEAGYRLPETSDVTDRLEAGYRPPRDAETTRFDIFDDSPWPLEKLVPLEVEKGTLIVLHPLLPHLSRENKSPKSRHAYTLHVIDGVAQYPPDNWLRRSPNLPIRGF